MEQFRVVLSGNVAQGVDPTTARKRLAKLLGKDEPFAAQLLGGHSRTVKHGVDAATAVRYFTALRAIGVECKFEPDTLDFDDGEVEARAATFKAASSSPAASVPESAPLTGAVHVPKADLGTANSVKQANHVPGWQVFLTLFVFAPALFWYLSQRGTNPSTTEQRTNASTTDARRQTSDFSVSDLKWKRGEYLLAITGTVTNNTTRSYGYVQVEINLYDKGGALVGSTLANANNLAPNAQWKFSAPILVESAATFKVEKVTGF
jgi:hypothetical protein